MNFRADRARQITRAFVNAEFDGFERRSRPALSDFVMLTRYADDIDTTCAFEPATLTNTLGEYAARRGLKQLRIAETEKYAHVTFFFSGGREAPFDGESRTLIESPKVATYDLQPQMSAPEVTDALVSAIESSEYDLIVCNYANGDMVGHTGVFDAAVAAVETLDQCLSRLVSACEQSGAQMLITADHGNVERMHDHEKRPAAHGAHHRAGAARLRRAPAAHAGIRRRAERRSAHAARSDGAAEARGDDRPLARGGRGTIEAERLSAR